MFVIISIVLKDYIYPDYLYFDTLLILDLYNKVYIPITDVSHLTGLKLADMMINQEC